MHEELKAWMKAQGKNSPKVALEMDLSDGHIYNMVNGVSPITADFLIRFEWRYGIREFVDAFGSSALVKKVGEVTRE